MSLQVAKDKVIDKIKVIQDYSLFGCDCIFCSITAFSLSFDFEWWCYRRCRFTPGLFTTDLLASESCVSAWLSGNQKEGVRRSHVSPDYIFLKRSNGWVHDAANQEEVKKSSVGRCKLVRKRSKQCTSKVRHFLKRMLDHFTELPDSRGAVVGRLPSDRKVCRFDFLDCLTMSLSVLG